MHYVVIINCSLSFFICFKICIQIDGSGRYKLLLDGSLQIIGLYRKDSGIYICTADNGIGQPIQRVYQLEVTGKLNELQISKSEQNLLNLHNL
jgi:hypothetical protein